MAAWKEKTKAQTVANLKNAVDIGLFKGTLVILAAIFALFLLIFIWPGRNDPEYWKVLGWLALILFVPFGIYCAWRMFRIFRKAESYIFCRTVLGQPHYSHLFGMMYFIVVIEDLEGRKFPAQTTAVFRPGGYIPPLVEEYVNKSVTVGYNEETGMVVVIE